MGQGANAEEDRPFPVRAECSAMAGINRPGLKLSFFRLDGPNDLAKRPSASLRYNTRLDWLYQLGLSDQTHL